MKLATRRLLILGFVEFTFFLFAGIGARADLLFSRSFTEGAGFDISASGVYITVNYAMGFSGLFPLFDSASWGVGDVGTTRTLTQATDPDFSNFVERLTDGDLEQIVFWLGATPRGTSGYGMLEPDFIYGNPADPRVDLHGYRIDSISLFMNSLTIDSPGGDPNGDGQWTDVNSTFTLSMNGEPVPEPSPIILAILGAGALSTTRRHLAHRS